LLALVLVGTIGLCANAQPASAPEQAASAGRPTFQEVTDRTAELKADPQFGSTHKEKTLRFKPTKPDKKKPTKADLGWFEWLRDFALWLTEAGRVLIWAIGAVLVALLIVGLRHWVRERAGAASQKPALLPSHVRDLDIRPESLPDQIGAAAAALWQRGEHRAALSLLYRGALSRLVHDHGVPIRAASTEGECVVLAARRLAPQRSGFFARLVTAWQQAVYGGREPESTVVLALCADFDQQLQRAAPQGAAP
jgi:hypothetical protein